MKLLLLLVAVLLLCSSATARNAPTFAAELHAQSPTVTKWEKAVNDGRTLYYAMQSKDSIARWFFKDYPDFADTVQSPFDGDLRATLREWGYKDDEELSKKIEKDCDFDAYHKIKNAFDDLGLDTRAKKDGGPNQGFRVDHQDGPAIKRNEDGSLPGEGSQYYEVCGKQYRATTGTYEFIVNPAGMVALMNAQAPAFCANLVWGRKAATAELPHIRAASDIAWGMWNRAGASDLKNIKYLLVTQIMNPTTRELITRAYQTLNPPQSQDKVWPGVEFDMTTDGGQAILGSPVGRWAGYFLMQHKRQLGGNRFISKVRVFKNQDSGSLSYLCFYVNPDTAPEGSDTAPSGDKLLGRGGAHLDFFELSRVVKISTDGKEMLREHVMRL